MKGKTNIIGLVPHWRTNKGFDAFRVFISKGNETIAISAKIQPTLKQINQYLRANKMRRTAAEKDNHFQALKNRLFQELKSEHGLKTYRILERMDLETKQFNFADTLDEFVVFKDNTAVPYNYECWMRSLWLPFFLDKGCEHPSEFKGWQKQALIHLKSAKTRQGKSYSVESHPTLAGALNQYMDFLLWAEYITKEDHFHLKAKVTLEDRKRIAIHGNARNKDTYERDDLYEIKMLVDTTYADDLIWKIRAYACFFGICTGLRRGNLLGLTGSCLHPDAETPHFETRDNIVNGWSRGQSGVVVIPEATKTGIGIYKLPLIQPDKKTLIEVTRFLKNNVGANERLLQCHPDTVASWWQKIAKECGFRYLNPHTWKHSYATVGGINLEEFYKGNPYLLQVCCMHRKFQTTQKYLDPKQNQFLEKFK